MRPIDNTADTTVYVALELSRAIWLVAVRLPDVEKLVFHRLEAGDTVIFSSKQIPGNEVAIGRIQNTLAAKAYRDRLANYDLLTGLPNRNTFVERLDWALRHAVR